MTYVYHVVILHATAREEHCFEFFTREDHAHTAFAISYHKIALADRPAYRVQQSMLHNEPTHL